MPEVANYRNQLLPTAEPDSGAGDASPKIDFVPANSSKEILGDKNSTRFRVSTPTVLLLILLIALALRVYGINWDQGGLFHPDERAFLSQVYDLEFPEGEEWGHLTDPRASTLNPGSFNWGSLPHYSLKIIHYAVSPYKWMDLFELRFAGRALSALSDIVTVWLVYLIGKYVFSSRVGVLAALFSAIAVQHIQLSHFFAVDTFITTFVVATIYFSIKVAEHGRRRDSLLAGVMFGCALATKFSVLPLSLALISAHVIYITSIAGDRYKPEKRSSVELAVRRIISFKNLVLTGLVVMAVLVVTQPYMFLDFKTYIDNISTQGEMVRREVDFPFTRQYEDTPKYLYQIVQLGTWGLGPVLGLTVWLGLLTSIAAGLLAQRKADLVILAWVIPYLMITGWFDVKFMRYMLPITPFLILYGTRMLWWMFEIIKSLKPDKRWLRVLPIVLVLIFTAHYSLSFMNVYAGQHPVNDVSKWLEDNADWGDRVVQEHWEEGIPNLVWLEMHERAELYNDENSKKFDQLTEQMSEADYFVLLSNRLYGTIPRLEERYPVTTIFYEKMFNGELGFELVYSGGRYIGGLGVDYYEDPFARIQFGPPEGFEPPSSGIASISFGWADESFSVYEHPQTFIFENVEKYSDRLLKTQIGASREALSQFPPAEVGLMLSDEAAEIQRNGGTWSSITFLRWLPDWLTPVVWYLAAQLFALIILPISFLVFRPLPYRGYLLAKPLGLLLVSTTAWSLVSFGFIHFSFTAVLLALIVLILVSCLILRVVGGDLLVHIKSNLHRLLRLELLLLAAFLAFLFIRAANPDLWHPWKGGEKPMDFAYLNAVVKSSTIPPYDPWNAGGYLNYYYFGQFMIATLIRFTGIVPSVAYNLAVPLLFMMTVAGVYAIVHGLAELTLRARQIPAWSRKSPVIAGLVAVVFVAISGNIDGLLQVLSGLARVIFQGEAFGSFDFWRSSRMMEPESLGNEITEFPFFTFLFADLHAHLIAIPIAITAIAAAISVFLRMGRRRSFGEVMTGLIVLGILVGSLRTINAWDFPTQFLLACGFIFAGQFLVQNRSLVDRLFVVGVSVIVVLIVGYLVYLPFHSNFELFNNGLLRSEFKTILWRYLLIHSIFMFLIVSWVVYLWRERLSNSLKVLVNGPVIGTGITGWTWHFLIVVFAAAVATLSLTGSATIAFALILGLLVTVSWIVGFRAGLPESRYLLIPVGMVVMAMSITGGVDVFTVKDDIGRMNTVFKFYLQAWILLAMASAYFLWFLWDAGKLSFSRIRLARSVWISVLAIFMIGVMIYPILGTRARNLQRFDYSELTLDGMAYMKSVTYNDHEGPLNLKYDYDAIRWMQHNIEGSPVIIEGLSDQYRWGNRVSIYTGLPAVIGWDWHQRQQRVGYAYTVTDRRFEVDQFFNSGLRVDAIETLDKYNVKYVYVGEMERAKYREQGIKKFERMQTDGLVQVYPSAQMISEGVETPVVIYEYIPPN